MEEDDDDDDDEDDDEASKYKSNDEPYSVYCYIHWICIKQILTCF